ncbi:MAG: AarF/UbiB family protein, partial [Dehalococcoidia bacterium]
TAVDGVAIAKELNARILEECDYIREATYQERFAEAFSSDPDITLPGVVWDRTKPNVITSDWKDGDDVGILPAISNEEADKMFPKGYMAVKPYLRITPQPNK